MANTKNATAQKKAVPVKKATAPKVAATSKPIKLGGKSVPTKGNRALAAEPIKLGGRSVPTKGN